MNLRSNDEYQQLTRVRLESPQRISELAHKRPKHPGPRLGTQNFIVAADHPARGALGVGRRGFAMADRRELLNRLLIALENPAVDGVLATADILEDLLLLEALDGKLIFGSMNRGGLSGLVNEIDDRFTGYSAENLERFGANGGKMLTRICYEDPATVRTLHASASAIDDLAERGLIAMVEPFISYHTTDPQGQKKIGNDLSPEAVIAAMAIASGLGGTSAYTWLKIPVVPEMERVVAATTAPLMLLGGDPGDDAEETFARWENALGLPGVQGLTVGRSVLYPQDDNVEAAVEAAALLIDAARDGGGGDL